MFPYAFAKIRQHQPAVRRLPETDRGAVRGVMLSSIPYHGKPTEVFAYIGYPAGAGPHKPVPGVVLVHGGGGSAFPQWVERWNRRGYAAIALDLEGHIPDDPNECAIVLHTHETAGPCRQDDFSDVVGDSPEAPEDQWFTHALAAIFAGHAVLRNDPCVRTEQIGICGISWGGILTSMAICADDYAFAVPIYGCAHLAEGGTYLADWYQKPQMAAWDWSDWLSGVKIPVLWQCGTDDVHFSPLSLSLCCRDVTGSVLSLVPGMEHGHGAWDRPEAYAFADSVCFGTPGLVDVMNHPCAWEHFCEFRGPYEMLPVKVETVYAMDGLRYDRAARACLTEWATVPRRGGPGEGVSGSFVPVDVPYGAKAFFVHITDGRGLEVASRVVTLPQAAAPGSPDFLEKPE